ncbi:MAG: right-handed parallel beta-helix repeat-containing protein [Acidobacteriota bacterium]
MNALLPRAARPFGAVLLLLGLSAPARGQCHTVPYTGGSATVTLSSGFAVSGSSPSAMDTLDGTTYDLSNVVETADAPSVGLLVQTWVENGVSPQGPVFYGAVLRNPTNAPLTVTSGTFSATVPPGRFDQVFSTVVQQVAPDSGAFSVVDPRTLRWTGSLTVPPHEAAEFLVLVRLVTAPSTYTQPSDITLSFSAATASGNYTASTTQRLVNWSAWAADVVTGFDLSGTATFVPRALTPAVAAGQAASFSVRLRHTDDQNPYNLDDMRAGCTLTVTVPKGWSGVSVSRDTGWWNAPTIVQPTATTDGSVTATTRSILARNQSTPAGSFVITATAPGPLSSNAVSLQPFTLALAGSTRGDTKALVRSSTQAVVPVVSTVGASFRSPALNVGGIRELVFTAVFGLQSFALAESVAVEALQPPSTWVSLGTFKPGASFATASLTVPGNQVSSYLDGAGRMTVRFTTSPSGAWHRLRLDFLEWRVEKGLTVNNQTGSDANPGTVDLPLRTIQRALQLLQGQGAVYVEVGLSRSGTPYASGSAITSSSQSGTASCRTLVTGVPSGGLLPLVMGTDPTQDVGFEVSTPPGFPTVSDVEVRNLEFQGCLVGVAFSQVNGTTVQNCRVTPPALGYGFLVDGGQNCSVEGCQVDAANADAFYGVFLNGGTGHRVTGTLVRRIPRSEGIFALAPQNLVLDRNLSVQNYMGIHVEQPAGTLKLSNNTLDANAYLGLYVAQASQKVTSRNNAITNNGVGWGTDSPATAARVDSDYEDAFGNTSGYAFHGTVSPGAHSLSAAPLYTQTTNPDLPDFYQPAPGSPLREAGADVGLPFCGGAPEIGAVEVCP